MGEEREKGGRGAGVQCPRGAHRHPGGARSPSHTGLRWHSPGRGAWHFVKALQRQKSRIWLAWEWLEPGFLVILGWSRKIVV